MKWPLSGTVDINGSAVRSRTEEDTNLIDLLLTLFRNLLFVPDPSPLR